MYRLPIRSALRITCPVLLLAAAPAAWSQVPPPDRDAPGAREEVADSDTLDRRRLLTLADGRILRVRSKLQEDTWLRRSGRDWVPVEGDVVGARLEREVLAEAEKLRRAVGSNQPERRCELARWLVGQGLHREALIELNRVLRSAPDHPQALRAIRECPVPLDLPADTHGDPSRALKAVLAAGAGGSPAKVETAVVHLASFAEVVDVGQVLRLELGARQYGRRTFAARAARRLMPGKFREELVTRAILDGWRGVREEAAFGLRDGKDQAVIGPALRGLGSSHANVRANSAEALGNMGYAAAVEPLMNHLLHTAGAGARRGGGAPSGTRANIYAGLETAYLMDFNVEIAQAASIADPIVAVQPSGVCLDVRSTVQMNQTIELRTTMRSLRQLTGEEIPDHVGRWRSWWDKNAESWRATDRARAFREAQAGAGASGKR